MNTGNKMKSQCPKCGLTGQYGVEFAITYHKRTKAKPEYMRCECDRCGYTWARQPEDYAYNAARRDSKKKDGDDADNNQ